VTGRRGEIAGSSSTEQALSKWRGRLDEIQRVAGWALTDTLFDEFTIVRQQLKAAEEENGGLRLNDGQRKSLPGADTGADTITDTNTSSAADDKLGEKEKFPRWWTWNMEDFGRKPLPSFVLDAAGGDGGCAECGCCKYDPETKAAPVAAADSSGGPSGGPPEDRVEEPPPPWGDPWVPVSSL
jgi:hypothetical protein